MSTKLTKRKIEKPDEQQEYARHEEILAILWEKHLATKKQLKLQQRFSKLPDLKKLLQSDLVYNILSFFDIFDLANFKKVSKLFNQTVNLIFSNMKTVDVSNVSCNKMARLYSKEGILKFIDTFTKLENLSLYNEEASLPMGWLDDNLLMDVLQKAKLACITFIITPIQFFKVCPSAGLFGHPCSPLSIYSDGADYAG